MAQYVYTMNRVGKIVPAEAPDPQGHLAVLRFPGAKIGVLGLNGSGKSTLLKIMAGLDHDIEGEAVPMPDLKIGYLPQEPQLDPAQNVRQAVEEGIGGVLATKKRLDEVYAAYAEPDADFDALAAEQARLEAEIAAAGSENTDLQLELAADALRLPPWEATVGTLSAARSGALRCAGCCCPSPTCCSWTSRPTTSTPNRWSGSRSFPASAFRGQWSRSPTTATSSTTRPSGSSSSTAAAASRTRATTALWLDQKEQRLELRAEDRRRAHQGDEGGAEVGALQRQGAAGEEQGAPGALRGTLDVDYQKRNETNEIFIPVGDRLGHEVIEFSHVSKSFGDRLLIDDLSFRVPAGAIVGIIGPNGAGKSTLFRMINGREKPDSGEVKIGSTVKLAFVDQSREELQSDKTVWQDVSGAWTTSSSASS